MFRWHWSEEWIRQEKRSGTFYADPLPSLAAELLMGAGLIERIVVGYIGFEQLGLAPVFRRLVEKGTDIEIIEADPGSMLLGLQAGYAGQPFAPLPPGLERTSFPATRPVLQGSSRPIHPNDRNGSGSHKAVSGAYPLSAS